MKIISIIYLILCLMGCQNITPILGSSHGYQNAKIVSDVTINSLRVRVVRTVSEQCVEETTDHMQLSGPIGPDSSEVVRRMLMDISPCHLKSSKQRLSTVVFLNSNGGLMKDGYKLGQIFREYEVTTVATEDQFCASSCAIAFLGGFHRVMQGNAKLMFHAPYIDNGQTIKCPTKDDARDLSEYFKRFLGESNGKFLFERTMDFCSKSKGWEINADAANLFGITTK